MLNNICFIMLECCIFVVCVVGSTTISPDSTIQLSHFSSGGYYFLRSFRSIFFNTQTLKV